MTRTALCTLVLLGFASATRAGELDRESAPAPGPTVPTPVAATAGTELDRESPQSAHRWHGGWGHGGWGYGGYRGYGFASFGFGGGFYRPYYPSFYRPYFPAFGYTGFYGGFYRPYYGYSYVGFGPTFVGCW